MSRMIAAVAAIAVLAPIPAALAKNPRDVAKSARCSAGSIAKLKLSPENGRIEVEFEVDQNRNGVPWRWALARPGTTLRSGTAVTRAPSGSFSVRKLVANRPGPDRLTVRASREGEVCRVTATL